jgi:hypothetical protein
MLFQIHGTFGKHNESSTVRNIPHFLICDVFGCFLHYHGTSSTYTVLQEVSIYQTTNLTIISWILNIDMKWSAGGGGVLL